MPPLSLSDLLYTKQPLRFGQDGRYRILMVSDIHGGVGYSLKTPQALDALLEGTKPNLVLLGGDIAGPGTIHVENEAQLRAMLDTLCAPMESRDIPWAHVYGNHDNNFGLSNDRQQPVYESYPHCVSKAGPEDVDGTGNYALAIWDAEGSELEFIVYGLDSHRNLNGLRSQYHLPDSLPIALPGHGGNEDTLHANQVCWYLQASRMLEAYAKKKTPALMYMHIPLPEISLIPQYPELCAMEGHCGEMVSHSALNSGMFSAVLQRGDVKAIFCGHDHENDFSGVYCGIRMGFDGFMSYHASHNADIRGGRIFDLRMDRPGEIETRMVRVKDFWTDSEE